MKNSVLMLTSMACMSCAMLTLGVILGLAMADLWQAAEALTGALAILVAGACVSGACIKERKR